MESLLIDDEHGRAKKVVQLQVTEVKMPNTMRMIAYQGPLQHLIERALSDDRRAGKAGVARGLVSDLDSLKAPKGQDHAAPDSQTSSIQHAGRAESADRKRASHLNHPLEPVSPPAPLEGD